MNKMWQEGKISDVIARLESGVSVNGEDRPKQPQEKAVLKVSAVSYGYFNPLAHKVINVTELSLAKTLPKKGQIIISRSNTEELVGASAYIDMDYYDLFLPDKLWQTVPQKNNHNDMKWLSYVLASSPIRYRLSRLSTGTSGSMKNITQGELLTLKIPIPPIPEQIKIASILSTWDNAINTVQKLLANSQQQKKALMQQLLTGKKRFAGFEGEWEEKRLDEISHIFMGSSPKSEFYNEDGIGLPLLQGNADIKNRKSVPRIFTSQITRECLPDDILLSVRAPVGAIASSNHHACIGRGIAAIRAKEDTTQVFLYQWLLNFEDKWDSFSQGSTFESVNSDDINNLKIKLPSLPEQQKIAAVLTTADQEIDNLRAQLNHLKQEKKALMQQLLTGKRRVKVEEAA